VNRQILLCIREVRGTEGEPLAYKGKTYTMYDTARCSRCGGEVVSLEEVQHSYTTPCIPGANWLPKDYFIPINDPDFVLEAKRRVASLPA